ncbi:MAG TPA: PEP-CTERM sorting domain-containing protein [Candidatus Binatus sp.]|jgi:hypothetical protein|nr:PEP-CTERM sorting domain-containing protein [Candidatus Binatus sp.]
MRKSVWIIAVLFVVIGAPASHAGSITYKNSDIATGSIGDRTFAGALVTITIVGNTSNVTTFGSGIFANVGPGTVTISGIGTFSFEDVVGSFVNQGLSQAGIVDFTDEGFGILGTGNSAFATYGLTTAIGPISGTGLFNPELGFSTTDGSLIFSEVGPDSTFTATTSTSATPEPSSLLLFGTSLLGLVPFRRKLFGR